MLMHCRERVDHYFATARWPVSWMEAYPCHLPSWDWIGCHLVNTCVGIWRYVWQSWCDVLLLIRSLACSSPTVTVQQHEGKNANVMLMHIGLIAGTPVLPKLAFSVMLLEFFYHLCCQQLSISVQGFVKASCTLAQVCFPLSIQP